MVQVMEQPPPLPAQTNFQRKILLACLPFLLSLLIEWQTWQTLHTQGVQSWGGGRIAERAISSHVAPGNDSEVWKSARRAAKWELSGLGSPRKLQRVGTNST